MMYSTYDIGYMICDIWINLSVNEHDAHKQHETAQNDARQRGGRAGRTQMLGKRILDFWTRAQKRRSTSQVPVKYVKCFVQNFVDWIKAIRPGIAIRLFTRHIYEDYCCHTVTVSVVQWQSWSQISQDSTLLAALRRWWQSLTRLRFCGHLFLDCSCGPKSLRRLGTLDNLYEDDSHDYQINPSPVKVLQKTAARFSAWHAEIAEPRVNMCEPNAIFWKILNGRIRFPTRSEKHSDILRSCTFFQDKKTLV